MICRSKIEAAFTANFQPMQRALELFAGFLLEYFNSQSEEVTCFQSKCRRIVLQFDRVSAFYFGPIDDTETTIELWSSRKTAHNNFFAYRWFCLPSLVRSPFFRFFWLLRFATSRRCSALSLVERPIGFLTTLTTKTK